MSPLSFSKNEKQEFYKIENQREMENTTGLVKCILKIYERKYDLDKQKNVQRKSAKYF